MLRTANHATHESEPSRSAMILLGVLLRGVWTAFEPSTEGTFWQGPQKAEGPIIIHSFVGDGEAAGLCVS